MQRYQFKASKDAGEGGESAVRWEGYCRGGSLRMESEKETHKSTGGMLLLRLLSMERAHSIKSRHV